MIILQGDFFNARKSIVLTFLSLPSLRLCAAVLMHPRFIVTIVIIVLSFLSLNLILIYKSKNNLIDVATIATTNDNNDDKGNNDESGIH